MRVLLVGGSGYVGTMCMPHLKPQFDLRVLDLVPPNDPSVESVQGSVQDTDAVRRALEGMEAVVYMAMARFPDGKYDCRTIDANYDVHVKHLHRVLQCAAEAKIARTVYTSSMSVHGYPPNGIYPSEDLPCNAPDVYGFTKWLGELVCEHFVRVRKMAIVSLRLNMPMPLEDWQKSCRPGRPATQTAAPDVASSIALGLTVPLTGFHTVFISGDHEGKLVNCSRAKQLLAWEPRERPRQLASQTA
jgi:nucleoside-diphosphate-sugar epimerase